MLKINIRKEVSRYALIIIDLLYKFMWVYKVYACVCMCMYDECSIDWSRDDFVVIMKKKEYNCLIILLV